MRHKLCRSFHPWCPGVKNRCLLAICAGNSRDAGLWCFFGLRLNKRLSKHSWGWWFETPSRPLWRHRNVQFCSWLPSWQYNSTASGSGLVPLRGQAITSIINSSHLDKMTAILADDISKCIFLNENDGIPIQISLKFVPSSPIDKNPALVQVMAWRRTGDRPLPESMMAQFIDLYTRY